MMDIVFNHTSHDSWLVYHHPEWFYHNPSGEIAGRVEDWTDIVDLDYSHPELQSYLIETLKLWAKEGVDGFRCDVASLVPVEFWQQARAELKKINPGIIWLAESSDPDFILKMRSLGWNAQSDGELFQAFDITYDYDVYHTFQAYLHGQVPQKEYLFRLRQQESIYPQNYLKLRFIENHDQPRIRSLIFTEECWRQWAAFSFFEKGVALIYSGQETRDPKQPSLFEKDIFDWGTLDPETSNFFKKLSAIKKESIIGRGYYQIHHSSPLGVIRASYQTKPQILQGVFNVEGKCGFLKVDCKDGSYRNLIDGKEIQIQDGVMKLQNEPIIFYGETEP
jgi:glycosidase